MRINPGFVGNEIRLDQTKLVRRLSGKKIAPQRMNRPNDCTLSAPLVVSPKQFIIFASSIVQRITSASIFEEFSTDDLLFLDFSPDYCESEFSHPVISS